MHLPDLEARLLMHVARWILRTALVVFVLALGGATAAVLASQTAWFRNWLRGYIVAEARQYLNGTLSIDRLDGNLFTGVELGGLSLVMDGQPLVHVDEIGLTYSLYHIVTSGIAVDELRLTRPRVSLRHDAQGLMLGRVIRKQAQEAERQGPQSPIDVHAIVIQDGALDLADLAEPTGVHVPNRIERLDGELSFRYEPVRYSLDVRRLSFRGAEPELALHELSGGVAVKDDTVFIDRVQLRLQESGLSLNGAIAQYLTAPRVQINASSDKVSLPELAPIVTSLAGIELAPAVNLALEGPLDRMQVDLSIRSAAGNATAKVVTDIQAPSQSVRGELSIEHANLAPLVRDPAQASDLTARATVDLQATSFEDLDSASGHVDLDATRLAAAGYALDGLTANADVRGRRIEIDARGSGYGAKATAKGRVTVPEGRGPLVYDLAGTVRSVDLRRLPASLAAPRVATDLNASYHAAGTQAFAGGAPPARSEVDAELTFAASALPGVAIEAGSTAALARRGATLSYRADAGVRDLDLREIGQAFAIPALDDPRSQSAINGRVTMEGSGTTLAQLRATANGALTQSTIAGATVPGLSFSASIADETAHVSADGRIAALDPARLAAKPELAGKVGGVFTLDATAGRIASGVSLDTVAGHAELTLDPSDIGGLAIANGYVNVDYRDQVAQVNSFDVSGPDIDASASGRVALDERGASNLVVHASSPRLAELARLVDQPVEGLASVDATVTGNRTELQIAGTLQGDGVKYEDNGALSLEAAYTARVPNLTIADAHVQADVSGTFVTVAGQNINEVKLTGTYEQRQVSFDGTARQPERTLTAAGDLLLHPDHQEVHLQRLSVNTANQQWDVAAGKSPAIRYAADGVEVRDLTLVSGDQSVSVDGRFGHQGEALALSLDNVDLASVEALLLRPPQFTGRINATAQVSGSREAPEVRGEFQVASGAFRQFTYDAFGGTVDYSRDGIVLDTRLDQNATQWITAKGHLPANLLAARAADAGETGHVEPRTPAERVDLTIDSSPLGLGLIQGFTPQVTDVTGTLEAHVHVTGSAADPHPVGAITVADGAMTVAATGVAYSHIAGRIDLQPERVHIDQITVLDNHQSALSVTGDLAVHQREVQAGQLWINAEDFKVVDNKLGNVRVQSAIELAGELRSPRVQGDFSVTTGRVDLDEILAAAGPSVYSTTALGDPAAATDPQPETPSIFEGLRMDLRVTVPNDLVIKATNLQAPGASIGLGALNVTLGGDLTARKDAGGPLQLVGAINTVRGTYDFQGRRFTILRDGTVRFEGADYTDPVLDLRTLRTIQGVEARADVRGRLSAPQIVLSSTPPLEQADILALIVFNQPLNQLGEGDQVSLAQRAQSLAAGAVAGQLATSLGRALNLDTFEIELAPENGSAAQLTFGQQLGQNLYLKVQQGVGDQSTTNLVVEYEINNWLRLQTNVMQGNSTQQSLFQRRQGSGVDLIVLFQK